MLSHFSCVWVFATIWTVALQALLCMGFSRQEYWNGLPFSLHQQIFQNQESNLCFLWLLHCRQILYRWATGEALKSIPLGLRETLPQTKWRIQLGASCMVKSSFCLFLSTFSVQFSSFAQSYQTICDPMDCSTPGLPVHHQLPELTQTHVHGVGDAIQPFHPLSSPSPSSFNLCLHQGLFN